MNRGICLHAAICFLLVVKAFPDIQTIINLPPDTWYAVPDTRLDASPEAAPNFLSPTDFEKIRRGSFVEIMGAWSGGVYDTKRDRLLIWGGGDNDYWGNEIYAFDVATSAWHRVTDPSLEVGNCKQKNPDGTPNGRHTYGGLAYIAHADRFFAKGGAWNCTDRGCNASLTWTFDFASKQWTDRNPAGTAPGANCGNISAYDPVGKKTYFGDPNSTGGLFSYDYDANQWEKLRDDDLYDGAMAVDPKRRLLVSLDRGKVYVYDIGQPTVTRQTWTTTGGDALVAGKGQGLDYDPVADRIVGWSGGSVYALNMDTKVWTTYGATGAPIAAGNGTYGRWRYSPLVNAFISANSVNENVYFFKLSAGAGTGLADRRNAAPSQAAENLRVILTSAKSRMLVLFTLDHDSRVNAEVTDLSGKKTASLADGFLKSGRHSFQIDRGALPTGLGVLRLRIGSGATVNKIFVIR